MAYMIRYSASIAWVGPNGVGMNASPSSEAAVGAPQGQRLLVIGAGQGSNTFTSSDITTITNAIASDLSTKFNANITQVQNFSSGGG